MSVPNPDYQVVAKRKSLFFGELTLEHFFNCEIHETHEMVLD